MPRVITFAFSDSIQITKQENGREITALVNPIAVLKPRYMPGTLSFGLTLSILDLDLSQANEIEVQVVAPSGAKMEPLGKIEIPPAPIQDMGVLHRNYHGIALNIDARNYNLPEEGDYKVLVIVNGEQVSENLMPVYCVKEV